MPDNSNPLVTIAVLGAGPRGVGVLERLAANIAAASAVPALRLHLVDPFPPGGGRLWRYDQSALLKLNSTAEDVTMFTDESATIDGPVVPGPSLIDWAVGVRSGEIADVAIDDDLVLAELAELEAGSFPTRRLHSFYLAWFYRRALAAAGTSIDVVVHADRAEAVDDLPSGDQLVHLAHGDPLVVDLVLYAVGHIGAVARPEHATLSEFATRNALTYLPPGFTADSDTSGIPAGEPVIVRGLGLAAVDLVVLLTEGRGGRFVPGDRGELDYLPSGIEPHLYLGSRRGVPYHSKIGSQLSAPRVEARFFTAEIAKRLEAESERLAFIDDVWPLIAKELLWGYYHELFVGHRDRVFVDWEEFARILESSEWNSEALRATVAAVVPDPRDRLDLEELDRPLAGLDFGSSDELQEHLREYIRTDLYVRSMPDHSANLALFYSLLYALFDLGTIIDSPKWTARSRTSELPVWWLNYFSFIASGPPSHRLDELLALSKAGIVTFLGANAWVRDDPAGVFVAGSPSVPGRVEARVLIDARLPDTDIVTSDNALLRSLVASGSGRLDIAADERGEASTGRLLVRSGDARVIRADGSPHAARFAIGAYTSAPFVGAFGRPRTNAVSFRENDRVARALIERATEIATAPALSRVG